MNGRRLYRSSTERVLGGVAGGVADYFDLDPALVRVAWAILILASGGIFLLLYLVMWFVVPEAPPGYDIGQHWSAPPPGVASDASTEAAAAGTEEGATAAAGGAPGMPPPSIAHEWAARRAERRARRSGGAGLVFGALLILIGLWFLIRDYVPWLRSAELWPIAIILLGVVLLVAAARSRSS